MLQAWDYHQLGLLNVILSSWTPETWSGLCTEAESSTADTSPGRCFWYFEKVFTELTSLISVHFSNVSMSRGDLMQSLSKSL